MGQIEHKLDAATPWSPTAAPISRALPKDRLFWLTAALLMILLAFMVLFPLRAAGDIALYVDIGGRVLDGQRPYLDFFDINPPTIHFLNILPVAFSRLTGLHPILVFHLFIWLIVAGTSFGIGHILLRAHREDRLGNLPPWLIPVLLVLGSYVTWLLIAFGQRDHIFILALPAWAVLRWYRWEGGQPPPAMAILVGILGAVGASLKPTFILGFGLVEAYGLLRYHRRRNYVTWEMLGAAIVVGLYGLYFITQPDILRIYLTEVTPSVAASYRSYGYVSAVELIAADSKSIAALCFAVLLAVIGLRQRALGRLYIVIAILSLSTVLAFALQAKGWRYHSLPMLNMIVLTGGLLLAKAFALPGIQTLLRRHRLDIALLGVAVVLSLFLGVTLAPQTAYGEATEAGQATFLRHTQPGDSAIVADIEVIPFYPAVIQTGRTPSGRYPMAYPLAFAYSNADALPDDLYDPAHTPPPLAQAYLDVLMEDIRTQQPQLILLRATPCDICTITIETGRYVKAHTDIEALLARDYDALGIQYPFEVYVRRGS
ncbi:MAG: hypothetical protein KJ065_13980 [Anaerolineae bacterium]|nr:hypothetical protein [Anaerolineae bacterium]